MDVMHSTLRDMEHFHTNLIQENDKLNKECEYSKVILYLVQENIQLRATNQTLRDTSSSVQENIQLRATNHTLRDTSSSARGYDDNNGGGNSASYDSGGAGGAGAGGGGGGGGGAPPSSSSFLNLSGSVAPAVGATEPSPAPDKSSFYRHLQANDGGAGDPSSGAAGPRTSSPDNFHTYLSSMQADDDSLDASHNNHNNNHNNHNNNNNNHNNHNQPRPQEQEQASGGGDDDDDASAAAALRRVRQPGRLLGEIAFQLDQRILSHIFQGQTRLYGFTVHNIGRKIADVSVHPVTGRADDVFRARLERRRDALMRRLGALGYKPPLHPTFTEFVVNAYGIAEQRGGGGGLGHAPAAAGAAQEEGGSSSQDDGDDDAHYLDDAHFLARLVASAAPAKLHRDLMVLLRCLAAMAAEDGRPLFLW